MEKKWFRSLIAWFMAGVLFFSIVPITTWAVQDTEGVYHSGPYWVMSDGKWYETGAMLDSPPQQTRIRSATVPYDSTIKRVDLSESEYFPPILLQKQGSCCSFAGVSYQFTYEMARLNQWNLKSMVDNPTLLNEHIFSPAFIFNMLNHYDEEENYHHGTNIWDVYNLLMTYGAVKEAKFPSFYNTGRPKPNDIDLVADVWCQDSDALLEALQYRISNYEICSFAEESEKTPIDNGPNSQALQDIKARLQNKQLVSIAVSMTCGYLDIPETNEKAIVSCYQHVDKKSGGHQITIVGYDDTVEVDINNDGNIDPNERGAFKIANSWGTDYGNDGFIWVMYDAINKESAGYVSYERQKWLAAKNENKLDDLENFGEIERLGMIHDYKYYCINVDTYDPVIVAEISFPLSDETNTLYRFDITRSDLSFTDYPKLKKSNPNINRATMYLDFTPYMDAYPYYVENYEWKLRYHNSNVDTIGEPITYKIKYYKDNVADYNQNPDLSYTEFEANGGYRLASLSFNLQYIGSDHSAYPIDKNTGYIEVLPGEQTSNFRSNYMGGELIYDFKGLSYVPTGATIQQKLFDRVYATYTTVLYGDINGDAAIDQNDVNLLQQYVNGQASLNGPYKEAAHIVRYYYGGTSDEITQRDVDLLSQRINEYKDIAEGYYTIQNSTNSLYLEKTDYEGGKPVRIHTASDGNGQIFKIEPTGDPGYYRIRAAFKPSFVLTCNVNTDNVTLSYQDDDKTKDKQIWSIAYDEKGVSFIPFQNPQKALALENGGTQAGTKAKLVNRTSATPTKYWIATKTIPKMTVPQGVYSVTSLANAQFYLDAKDAGTTNDTPVRTYSSTGGNHQKWFFKYHAEDGYYSIHPLHRPSICLTLSDTSSYKTVLQWDSGLATQRWMVIEGKNGDFRLAPASSLSQVLMTERADRYSYLKLGADNLAGDVSNQTKWLFTATLPNPTVHEGYYSFRNKNSGKYMDIDTHKAGALAPVVQYSEGVYDTQMWHVRQSSDGYYILSTVYDSRFVLCTDGERVYLSPEASSQDDSIKWLFIQSDDGTYRLSPKNYPSQAAVVLNASHSDNARLILWDDNQSTNGRWTLFDPTNYTDGDYTFTWQDDGMSEPRYMTSGRVFSESSGGYPYSTVLYNGTYTQYSSWKVEYQGDGYYTIKNNGNYGDSYEHYLSYDGAVVRCEISENPQEDDSIYWVITKEGLLIPKSYPDYAISVYGRSASDTQLSATNITSQDVIHWSIKK